MAIIGGKIGLSVRCALLMATLMLHASTSVQSFRLDSESAAFNDDYRSKSAYFSTDNYDQDSVCAQSCSTDSDRLIEYQQGQTYTYKVQLSTGLSGKQTAENSYRQRQSESQSSKVEIRAIADVSVHQPCEMVLRIRQVKIDGIDDVEEANQMKNQLERQSTHFAYEDGQVGDVCSEQDEPEWTVNIKKSILSAIQMSAKSLDEKSSVMETDINGQCQTEYTPINKWNYGTSDKKTTVMLKTKQLAKCNQRHQLNMGLFPRSYGLDQVIRSSMPIINATYECRQKIQDGIVIDAQCCDKQTIWPLNVLVDSDVRVQLIDQQQGLAASKSITNQFKRQNLGWMSTYQRKDTTDSQASNQDVEQLLKQICSQIQDSVEIQVPEMFAQLVRQKSSLSVGDEQQLYQSIQSGQICNSPKMVDIYLDASALSGTEGSVQVMIQAYQQQQHQEQQQPTIFPQRFSYLFSMLAFAKNPTFEAAQRLVEFVQQQIQQQPQEDFDQIVLGVSGFVHNLRQKVHDQPQQVSVSAQEVDTLVQNFQQFLVDELEQCIQHIDQVNVTRCLTLAKGVENVGLQIESNYQQQVAFVQKLIQIVQQSSGQQSNQADSINQVRVAIVQSLVDAIDDQNRENLIQQIVSNEQEPTVLRIEAYKTVVMSGAKISQLESIRDYIDSVEGRFEDLVNYIRSHQANLRSTSDLHRRQVLPLGAPEFKQPNGALVGMSRNYELSYLNEVYQMGVTAEADVIYGDQQSQQRFNSRAQISSIPQVIFFNLTIPIMGRELQAVQIRIHQNGLDQVLQDNLSKYKNGKNNADPIAIVSRLIDAVARQQSSPNPNSQVELFIQIGVDGKTIALFDQDQLIQYVTGNGQVARFFQNIFSRGQHHVSIDRAYSLIPVDFEASTTTSNGMPIKVNINSSIVIGFKTEANFNIGDGQESAIEFAVFPSIAAQMEAGVQYSTGSQTKSIQYMNRMYSAPQINLMAQLKGQEGVSMKWTMPEPKYTLIRFESNFRVNPQSPNEQSSNGYAESLFSSSSKDIYGNNYHQHQCTDFTKKPLGVALCYDASYKNEQQQSQWAVQLTVEKFDQQLTDFQIYLDNPLHYLKSIINNYASSGEKLRRSESRSFGYASASNLEKSHTKRSLKFVFNTPGSQIDRELAFELEVPTFDRESGLLKEARLRIQSPWKQIIAQAIARNQEHERVLSVGITVDNHQLFQMELGLELMKRGQKMEYRSKMSLASPKIMTKPIQLVGIWSYQQGRKTALFVSLEDVQQNRHYIKATFTKTGQMASKDLKASAHCMVDLAGASAKVGATLERNDRDMKLELSTDYQTAYSRAQSAQLTLKHQNLSWGKMIKFTTQGSWSCTQAPQYNTEYSHQFTLASNEFLEHDLRMGWNNDPEQLRIYQLVKLAEQRGKHDVEAQTICTVKPLKIDYQVEAQCSMVGFSTNGQKRLSLVATGHSRDNAEKDKIRAEVSYFQKSQQPLKIEMRAAVKSEAIDFVYNDDIEEKQPNNYNGHLLIQLTPKQKYSADYVYSVDKNSEQAEPEHKHQIDVTLNDAITKRLVGKQQVQFRSIANRLLEARSKLTGENDQDVFEGQLKLDQHGPSHCNFEYTPKDIQAKVHVSPYSWPKTGRVEFQNQRIKHLSNLQYDQEKLLKLHSKTEQNGKNILSIDSEICPHHKSHVTIDSNTFSGDCRYDSSSMDGQIQLDLPHSWSHDSKVSIQPKNGHYRLDSRTKYQDKNIADIESKYEQAKGFKVQVKTPSLTTGFSGDQIKNKYDVQFENDQIDHQSSLDCQPKRIKFESKTAKNGKNVATVSYDCGDDHIHQVKLDCDDLVKARGECKLKSEEPYAKLNVDWLQADLPIEHQTEIRASRPRNSIDIHSNTKLSDEKLAEIKAAIAKNPFDQKSSAVFAMDTPLFEGHAGYEQSSNDEDKISFGIDGKKLLSNYKHHTILKLTKRSIFDFKSETKSKKDNSNCLDVQGQYRHEDEEQPSEFDLKLGEIFQTIGKFNLFNKQTKDFDMAGQYQDKEGRRFEHETKAQYSPTEGSMKIDSKINDKSGRKIASIKSLLSKNNDQTSFFLLDSEDTKKIPKMKLEINPRMKRAAVDFDMDQIQHQSLFHNDNNALKVNTITSKNQQNVFNFNTEINRQPSSQSHVKVQVGPQYQSELRVIPEQQSGSFSFQTPSIRHSSQLDLNNQIGQASLIQSKTHYRNDLLADIDARLEGLRGENVVKANVPSLIRLDSNVDVAGRRVSFDAQSDAINRHMIGSIHASNVRPKFGSNVEGKEFHFDLAWDVDRDPRSRVSIDVGARRLSDQSIVASAQVNYAQNKLILASELTPRNIMSNSARVSLSYQPYDGVDSWQVIYSHINRAPQVECKIEFLLHDQVKYSARLTTQVTDERFVIGFQTTSPQNIDAQVNLNIIGVAKGQGEYYLKATLQRAVEDQYEVVATAEQDADYRIFVGKVEIRTPRTESQTVEYRVDLPGRMVYVHLVNPQTGHQFRLDGQIQEELAQLSLKSDIPYLPAIDGKVKYVPNEEFSTNLDVDHERMIEVQYKQKGFDSIQSGALYLLAKFQSVWTPSLELTAQSSQQQNGQGFVVTVEGKYNVEKILYGQVKRMTQNVDTLGQQTISFGIEGWISRPNGVKLIEAVSKFVVGGQDQSLIEYVLDVEPNPEELETIEPVYVVITAQRKPGQSQKMVGAVKISHGQKRRDWIDADLVVENTRSVYSVPVPEKIVATIRYVPTSTQATFEVSIMERLNEDGQRGITLFDDQNVLPQLNNLRVFRKYRNQVLASLDDRKIGFELITNQMAYRNTYENLLKLYSPQPNGRSIQYRTAVHYAPETFTYFARGELKSGYVQVEPIYQSTMVFAPIINKPTSYMVYYDVQSPVLMGDGQISARAFFFGPENKYQGVVASLKTSQNDEINFEATTRTEEEQSNQLVYYGQSNKVTYYNVSLFTQDQAIDLGMDGQVSGSGFIFNWHHQNRFGRPKSGSYRFQLANDNQLEAKFEHGNMGYYAKGQFRTKQGVFVFDGVVDYYQKTSSRQPAKYYGKQSQQQQQIVGQFKVHVEAKEECIRANIEDQQQQYVQQLSFCMDEDQSNILNLAVDSVVNGQKTSDLNVRFDTRQVANSVVLSFKWNPRYQTTLLAKFVQRFTSAYDQTEIVNEISYLVRVLSQKLVPSSLNSNRYQAFVDELWQIAADFGIDVYQCRQVIVEVIIEPIVHGIEKMVQNIYDYVSIVDQITGFVQKFIHSVEEQCYNSDTCRRVVRGFTSIDSLEKLIDVVSERMVVMLQQTHRIISTSYSGRWIRGLIPATVMDYLPDLIHQAHYYVVNAYAKMVQGNYPLAELFENIEHVLHEMVAATHWRSVQWNQVKTAISKIIQITLSPMRYSTSSRVLVYDPQQGQLQIELYGPAVQHPRYYRSKFNEIVKPSTITSPNVDGFFNYSQQRSPVSSYGPIDSAPSFSRWSNIFRSDSGRNL